MPTFKFLLFEHSIYRACDDKSDCDTDTDNATHFTHCFHKSKGAKKTGRSLWGCFFPPHRVCQRLPHLRPRRLFTSYLTNQDVKLSRVAVQTSHIRRGEISNPRADTPSLELLLPRTECALHHSWDIICCRRRLRLLHHLMKIPSLFGVTPLSALSVATELQKTQLIRKWTLIFFFPAPFQISYYISLYSFASAGNLDGHFSFEVLAVCSIAFKAICLRHCLEWLRSTCYTA